MTPTHPDARYSPASERNREPILQALLPRLPASGRALEVASGSGQHLAHFAPALPGWHWLASDPDPAARASIPHWWPAGAPPLALDLLIDTDWPLPPSHAELDLIYSANMLHISAPDTSAALMGGAGRYLSPRGQLVVYGPFIVPGEPTAPSNLAFDADLQARHPEWGLRSLADLQDTAAAFGLTLRERLVMPANNLLLVFARTGLST
jgi:SAM-dependent methyltransferase